MPPLQTLTGGKTENPPGVYSAPCVDGHTCGEPPATDGQDPSTGQAEEEAGTLQEIDPNINSNSKSSHTPGTVYL